MRNKRLILSYWREFSHKKEQELEELIQGAGLKKTKKTTFSTAENIIKFVVRAAPSPLLLCSV